VKPERANVPKPRLATLYPDAVAGLTVALVALPLALAFGQASGLGAHAGITTAIIAGFLAAAFGGSRFQVSGPTGAMTVVLIPIAASLGTSAVLFVGLLAGIFLVAAGTLRIGHHVHRLPTSVIEGFTAGIALVIAMQQIPAAFGVNVSAQPKVWQTALAGIESWLAKPDFTSISIAITVAALVYLGNHRWARVPVGIVVLLVATFVTQVTHLRVTTVAKLPSGVGTLNFDFLGQWQNWSHLLVPALAVAALAALESLLSAKVADKMRGDGTEHNSDRELIGQGIANLAVPFFGGVPATAALARTAVNVRSGAQTRLAAILHAVFLAGIVILLADFVQLLPMPALAGVLLATAAHMIKPSELLLQIMRSKLDGLVLILTLALTVTTDLTTALVVGAVCWLLLRKTNLNGSLPSVDPDETLGD
jgi:SulP family sulfate permease